MTENKKHFSALDKVDEVLLRCNELQQRENKIRLWFALNALLEEPEYKMPSTGPQTEFIYFPRLKDLGIEGEEKELLDLLKDLNFIKVDVGSNSQRLFQVGNEQFERFQLTVESYKRIQELTKSVDSKQAFIAMWFNPKMDGAFKAIEDACAECGFQAYRVDKDKHNENITFKIIGEIKRSKFLIADFTGDRGGVYWEAGFAKGLGREVIHCMRQEEFNKTRPHFDVQQINFIIWIDEEDLKNKLIEQIEATVK